MNPLILDDYQPCPKCGKYGYIDERRIVGGQYLCARCCNPHLMFD